MRLLNHLLVTFIILSSFAHLSIQEELQGKPQAELSTTVDTEPAQQVNPKSEQTEAPNETSDQSAPDSSQNPQIESPQDTSTQQETSDPSNPKNVVEDVDSEEQETTVARESFAPTGEDSGAQTNPKFATGQVQQEEAITQDPVVTTSEDSTAQTNLKIETSQVQNGATIDPEPVAPTSGGPNAQTDPRIETGQVEPEVVMAREPVAPTSGDSSTQTDPKIETSQLQNGATITHEPIAPISAHSGAQTDPNVTTSQVQNSGTVDPEPIATTSGGPNTLTEPRMETGQAEQEAKIAREPIAPTNGDSSAQIDPRTGTGQAEPEVIMAREPVAPTSGDSGAQIDPNITSSQVQNVPMIALESIPPAGEGPNAHTDPKVESSQMHNVTHVNLPAGVESDQVHNVTHVNHTPGIESDQVHNATHVNHQPETNRTETTVEHLMANKELETVMIVPPELPAPYEVDDASCVEALKVIPQGLLNSTIERAIDSLLDSTRNCSSRLSLKLKPAFNRQVKGNVMEVGSMNIDLGELILPEGSSFVVRCQSAQKSRGVLKLELSLINDSDGQVEFRSRWRRHKQMKQQDSLPLDMRAYRTRGSSGRLKKDGDKSPARTNRNRCETFKVDSGHFYLQLLAMKSRLDVEVTFVEEKSSNQTKESAINLSVTKWSFDQLYLDHDIYLSRNSLTLPSTDRNFMGSNASPTVQILHDSNKHFRRNNWMLDMYGNWLKQEYRSQLKRLLNDDGGQLLRQINKSCFSHNM